MHDFYSWFWSFYEHQMFVISLSGLFHHIKNCCWLSHDEQWTPLCCTMQRCAMLGCAMLGCVEPCWVVLNHAGLCDVAMLWWLRWCHAGIYHVGLWPCWVMLCYARVVLCIVLGFTLHFSISLTDNPLGIEKCIALFSCCFLVWYVYTAMLCCHAGFCYAGFCYAVCWVLLCCAVLWVVLCWVVPACQPGCVVMLGCVVLCWVVLWLPSMVYGK